MRRNLSPTESDVRVLVAVILTIVAIGAGIETVAGILAATAAVALFITALTGYCPVYDLFGASEVESA